MTGRLALELMGAVVGAGLASGREIASFFGQYGRMGYGGIAAAVAIFALLADAEMPLRWQNRWPERLWRGLSALLLMATGGAMLAGAGEAAAMLLPALHIRWGSMALTFLLAWLMARRSLAGLAWVSGLLLVGLGLLLAAGFVLEPMQAVPAATGEVFPAVLRGMTYGGFNAALLNPLLRAAGAPRPARRRSLEAGCLLLTALLCTGLATLARHPALLGEAMPFVRMAAAYGAGGGMLAALCLYLATLSTLTACLRSLGCGRWTLAGVAAFAMLGFSGVVGAAYPLLGAGCVVQLAAMRISGWKDRQGQRGRV